MPKCEQVFLPAAGSFADKINSRANSLYQQLKDIDLSALPIAAHYKDYFIQHHLGPRLFFSLQNSAHIIYDAVRLSGKKEEEIVFMDYGAGLGTLFMLAGMMNFKQTLYNDYLPEWQQTAQSICEAMKIHINAYVIGDIDDVMVHAKTNAICYDILASRNVVEHIYNLPGFYSAVYKSNPGCIIYSTTSANFHNPAMRWYHWYIHASNEKKYYRPQREQQIRSLHPSLSEKKIQQLTAITRGKGQQDFMDAISGYLAGKPFVPDPTLRSNTCDFTTGVWCEHLLTKKEHGKIINNAGLEMLFTAGYWDTHYTSRAKNFMAGILNRVISLLGKQNGILLSPFVNIIACQKKA